MDSTIQSTSWTFSATKWYGYIFAAMFILYGGVSIILKVLDHALTPENFIQPFLLGLLGIVLMSVVYAFAEGKKWGWYGLVAMNALILIGSLFKIAEIESILIGILSLGALAALLAPETRRRYL